MNHIDLNDEDIKSLINEARWDRVGISPLEVEEKNEVIEEASKEESEEESLEIDESLTLEDLDALLSVFPDNVLEEHAVAMAEVLNEAYEEQNQELVSESEYSDEDEAIGELVDTIVQKTLAELAAVETDEE